jgi:hypothetical protein
MPSYRRARINATGHAVDCTQVPQLLCHMGPVLRSILSHEALQALTLSLLEHSTSAATTASAMSPSSDAQTWGQLLPRLHAGADAECFTVFGGMETWFACCAARQQQQEQQEELDREGGRSALHTSIR